MQLRQLCPWATIWNLYLQMQFLANSNLWKFKSLQSTDSISLLISFLAVSSSCRFKFICHCILYFFCKFRTLPNPTTFLPFACRYNFISLQSEATRYNSLRIDDFCTRPEVYVVDECNYVSEIWHRPTHRCHGSLMKILVFHRKLCFNMTYRPLWDVSQIFALSRCF